MEDDEIVPDESETAEHTSPAYVDSSRPALDARSIVLSIDPEGNIDPGVSLKDLEEEVPAPPLKVGSEKYQVLKMLGRGGMGKVYLVHDRDLKRRVALKMILDPTAERQARFLEEAQIQGQLEHPNIVAVHELGLTDGKKPYYTMPVVRGNTLAHALGVLRRGDPGAERTWSITRFVQVFLQIAHAVEYAHAKGVLHRDLKPANVMLGEHGEVLLLDWGLSRLVDTGGRDVSLTSEGRVVGTPAYMSPEQAIPLELDARSDIYSLGVMLYEMLTLSLPFEGDSVAILGAHLRDAPAAPRARAPARDIPLELERICLKALEKRREDRYQSVRAMMDALQGWLEAEADRSKRHARAEERAREGRVKLEAYRALLAETRRLEGETAALAAQFRSWQPIAEKAPLHQAEDRLEAARDELRLVGSEVVGILTEALGFEGDNAHARELLSDYYWQRFEEAEANGDRRSRNAFGRLITRFDDGKYRAALLGTGKLDLESDPPGAEVWLHDFVEHDLQLAPRELGRLGTTPIRGLSLDMGSYLLVLRMPGMRDVRYPVVIGRNRAWSGRVRLHRDEEIGVGFVQVPAGPFIEGGVDDEQGRPLPRRETVIDEFHIGVHPVTMGEYLEFLNDLAHSDLDLALSRSPRHGPQGAAYAKVGKDGLLGLPDVDQDGDRWYTEWPVFLVSAHDAVAYCAWRSARDGCDVRLPTASEWEKAARGVDGRIYPWGNRFDASLCNVRGSRRYRPAPSPVSEYATDVSVYGVYGAAGNVQEWTSTEILVGEGEEARDGVVIRGGGWDCSPPESRCAWRAWNTPANVTHMLGFRVVRLPRDRHPRSSNR